MSSEKQKILFFRFAAIVFILTCAYFFLKYAIVWFMPFITALIVAFLLQTPVKFLNGRLRVPRPAASAFLTVVFYILAGFLVLFAFWQLSVQFQGFVGAIPGYLVDIRNQLSGINFLYANFLSRLPEDIGYPIFAAVEQMKADLSVPSSALSWAGNMLTKAAGKVPSVFIALAATIISTYFITNDYTNIGLFFMRKLSKRNRKAFYRTKDYLVSSIGRWLRAQGTLLLITFVQLTAGFAFLGFEYPGILGVLISLIDALPILGVGTVLVPWGAFSLLTGDYKKGLSLIVFYIIIAIVRNIIEPKIVGRELGLHPLATLISIYMGFKLFGVAGMLFMPIGVMLVTQFIKWGYFDRLLPDVKTPKDIP